VPTVINILRQETNQNVEDVKAAELIDVHYAGI